MKKLDKQIYEILNDFINHNLEVTYGEATSKIKQSILKAIMDAKPKQKYADFTNQFVFNEALDEFESVIKEILTNQNK